MTVYTYQEKPPLVTNATKKQGMYYDFTRRLNTISAKYRFEIVTIPRKRIERMLASNTLDGILLGVNPVWFSDKEELKYHWTPRIFSDRDEIVSLIQQSIEFIKPQSLEGKVFGGVRGFYYYGISELIAKQRIIEVNTAHEVDLFSMLLNQRIDVAVISRSTFDHMLKKNPWKNKFHLSKKPHDIYDRRILVPLKYSEVYQHIAPIIEDLQFDKAWQNHLKSY
ncbi:transporter substrate-binding domain-containing protein [Thalassotalea sp. SU-HH00458]|uniref:substrate-binding periplasmic protein n=1 Tax=Thalassotalea sp. SU-HH00458 TaxID=3127657 RepID=UPI0031061508